MKMGGWESVGLVRLGLGLAALSEAVL